MEREAPKRNIAEKTGNVVKNTGIVIGVLGLLSLYATGFGTPVVLFGAEVGGTGWLAEKLGGSGKKKESAK